MVTIRSEVFSQLKKIIYKCVKCGFLKGPFYINSINDVRLGNCTSCQSGNYLFRGTCRPECPADYFIGNPTTWNCD